MKPTPVQFEFAQYGQLTVDILAKKVVSFVELPLLYDSSRSMNATIASVLDPFKKAYDTWAALDGEVQACILNALDELASNGYGVSFVRSDIKRDDVQYLYNEHFRHSGPNPNYQTIILHHKIYTMRRIVTVARVGALVEDMDHLTMEE